ncbi:MAG: HAD family hydrolase [Candidatus Thermoplasmatota archaeon]|jgi:histidinol-phosphate phosphatase family protein|nr:HAD family hydrolase [Candidatus Thermoplasmatota archaeon]
MIKRALFIDRDGTINRDCPYCHDLKDLYIFQDAVEIMKDYRKKGYLIIIITNQSGINRGYFTDEQFHIFHNELLRRLKEMEVEVDETYYCPHRPEENCECRKPQLGMIQKAMENFDIDLKNSVIIGDRDDMEGEMGRKLGIEYLIVNRR